MVYGKITIKFGNKGTLHIHCHLLAYDSLAMVIFIQRHHRIHWHYLKHFLSTLLPWLLRVIIVLSIGNVRGYFEGASSFDAIFGGIRFSCGVSLGKSNTSNIGETDVADDVFEYDEFSSLPSLVKLLALLFLLLGWLFPNLFGNRNSPDNGLRLIFVPGDFNGTFGHFLDLIMIWMKKYCFNSRFSRLSIHAYETQKNEIFQKNLQILVVFVHSLVRFSYFYRTNDLKTLFHLILCTDPSFQESSANE